MKVSARNWQMRPSLPRSKSKRARAKWPFGQTEAHSSLQAMKSEAMFQTLDEQIERTEGGHPTTSARLVRFAEIAIVLVCLIGGLYFAIASFE